MKDIYKRLIIYSVVAAFSIYAYSLWDKFNWRGYTAKLEGYRYTIYSDLPRADLDIYAKICESLRVYFERKFFSTGTKKVKIYVFATADSYGTYLKKLGRFAPETEYGFYKLGKALIAFNSTTGLGTFTHELSHHFINTSDVKLPVWFDEGFSAFFEKFIGIYQKDGSVLLTFGYVSPERFSEAWHLKAAGRLSLLPLFSEKFPNESLACNFVLFAFDNDKLKELLNNTVLEKDSVKLVEEIFRRPLRDVEAEWGKWMEEAKKRPEIPWIAENRIFTADQLEDEMHKFYPPLRFDSSKERFFYDWKVFHFKGEERLLFE